MTDDPLHDDDRWSYTLGHSYKRFYEKTEKVAIENIFPLGRGSVHHNHKCLYLQFVANIYALNRIDLLQ